MHPSLYSQRKSQSMIHHVDRLAEKSGTIAGFRVY
jgi:hypothetical protein